MKIFILNEYELTERIKSVKADKDYDCTYTDAKPESYPCICVCNTELDFFGDHIFKIIDFIYPSDFT
jgi:hypothetical protein